MTAVRPRPVLRPLNDQQLATLVMYEGVSCPLTITAADNYGNPAVQLKDWGAPGGGIRVRTYSLVHDGTLTPPLLPLTPLHSGEQWPHESEVMPR
jgi:hypothetical protein